MGRRSRRRGKAWWDPVFLGLLLLPFTIVCIVGGLLSVYLRWMLLLGGSVDLIAGTAFYMYIAIRHDDENTLYGLENAPRTFVSTVVVILALAQLGLYVVLNYWSQFRWR